MTDKQIEEKIMSINELMDRIYKAQALAYQQHIRATAEVQEYRR